MRDGVLEEKDAVGLSTMAVMKNFLLYWEATFGAAEDRGEEEAPTTADTFCVLVGEVPLRVKPPLVEKGVIGATWSLNSPVAASYEEVPRTTLCSPLPIPSLLNVPS